MSRPATLPQKRKNSSDFKHATYKNINPYVKHTCPIGISPKPREPGCFIYLTEGFGNVSFHLPVHCPPHSEAVVIGLGCNVLPHWIPSETFYQTSVSSQTCYHFWGGKKKADQLTEFSFCMKSKSHWNVLNPEL